MLEPIQFILKGTAHTLIPVNLILERTASPSHYILELDLPFKTSVLRVSLS